MSDRPKILIVEDEALLAMTLQDILEESGCEVSVSIPTAEAAIEKIVKEKPDFVLMDINLSCGANGIDVAQKMLKTSSPKIVLMSGYSFADYEDELKNLDGVSFLSKPVDYSRLKEFIDGVD